MRLVCWVVMGLLVFFETGCVVRIYKQQMPRKDIVIEGNRGYIVGTPPPSASSPAKSTRTILVAEVELGNVKKLDVQYLPEKKMESSDVMPVGEDVDNSSLANISGDEQTSTDLAISSDVASDTGEKEGKSISSDISKDSLSSGKTEVNDIKYRIYKVQKGDTLQKISYKFYGKYSLWPKIYAANRDRLENPDSLYVGQELRIPIFEKAEVSKDS